MTQLTEWKKTDEYFPCLSDFILPMWCFRFQFSHNFFFIVLGSVVLVSTVIANTIIVILSGPTASLKHPALTPLLSFFCQIPHCLRLFLIPASIPFDSWNISLTLSRRNIPELTRISFVALTGTVALIVLVLIYVLAAFTATMTPVFQLTSFCQVDLLRSGLPWCLFSLLASTSASLSSIICRYTSASFLLLRLLPLPLLFQLLLLSELLMLLMLLMLLLMRRYQRSHNFS